jgi:hypothetical protein
MRPIAVIEISDTGDVVISAPRIATEREMILRLRSHDDETSAIIPPKNGD